MMEYGHGGDIYGGRRVALDYSVNTNPLGMPEHVKEAAVRAVALCGHYPDSRCRRLREKIAGFHSIKSDWVICGNGAAELIYCLAWAKRPGKALVLSPTFSEYEKALETVGCDVNYYELKRDQGFALDQGVSDNLTPDLDMVFFCNPNNPTGVVADRGLMKKILSECRKKKIFMVVDECFMEFVDQEREASLAECLEEYKNLFLLKAFTKSFGMAGFRLGYGLCADTQVMEEMEKSRQPWSVSLIAQEAGLAALEERAYLERTRELIGRERIFLTEGLSQLGFYVFESSANYLLFHEDGKADLWEEALSRGVLIRDCSNYRGLEKGDYRICIGNRDNNIKLLDVLKSIDKKRG